MWVFQTRSSAYAPNGTLCIEQIVVTHQLAGEGILDPTTHPFPHPQGMSLIADDHLASARILFWPDVPPHHEFPGIGAIKLNHALARFIAIGQCPLMSEAITFLEGLGQLDADAIGVMPR